MDKRDVIWKVDMFNRVEIVCDNNIAIIDGVPALKDSYAVFKGKLVIVKGQMELLSIEDNGLVATKDLAWKNLATSLKGITAGLRGYATKTNNLVLLAKAKYTKSAFTQDRGIEAITLANKLIELAQANIANLANYNVTPAKMKAAAGYLAELTTFNAQPLAQRSTDKVLLKTLKENVRDINSLLKSEMDELVRTLEEEETLFYGEYFAARRLVRTGIRHEESLTEEEAEAKRLKKEEAKLKKEEAEKKKEEASKKEGSKNTESKEASTSEASPGTEGQPDTNGDNPPAELPADGEVQQEE